MLLLARNSIAMPQHQVRSEAHGVERSVDNKVVEVEQRISRMVTYLTCSIAASSIGRRLIIKTSNRLMVTSLAAEVGQHVVTAADVVAEVAIHQTLRQRHSTLRMQPPKSWRFWV